MTPEVGEAGRHFAFDLLNTLRDWSDSRRLRPSQGQLLYHFTDAEGVAGILGNSVIRASLITAMNDCSEVQYGLDVARRVLERRLSRARSELIDTALMFLDDPTVRGVPPQESTPFVVSLCGRIDKSVHWLHYGQSGNGIAIGFEASGVLAWPGFSLVRVEYNPTSQEQLVEQLLDRVETFLAAALSRRLDGASDRLAGHLCSTYLRLLAAEMKSECFVEEEEWRLLTYQIRRGNVLQPGGDEVPLAKYRATRGRIVPYLETALGPTQMVALKTVVLGYSSPIQPADLGLQMLVAQANPLATIARSPVPVR